MKINKILSLVLAFAMICGTMGVTVFAEGEENIPPLPVAKEIILTGDALDVFEVGEIAQLDYGCSFSVDMGELSADEAIGFTEDQIYDKLAEKYKETETYKAYKDNYFDFEITFSNSGTALLVGNYGEWGWIPAIDFDENKLIEFEANKPFRVMRDGAPSGLQDLLKQTLKSLIENVKEFQCGVIFADMPKGTTVKLELCMYEREADDADNGEDSKLAEIGTGLKYENSYEKVYSVIVPFDFLKADILEVPTTAKSIADITDFAKTNDTVDSSYTIKLYNDATVSKAFSVPENESVTIDLNGKTLKLAAGGNTITGDLSFKNGTIDISDLDYNGDSLFTVTGAGSNVSFDNVTLQGDGYTSPAGVINMQKAQQTVKITNSTVDLKNEGDQGNGAFINASGEGVSVEVTNSNISLYKTRAGFVKAKTTLKNSTYNVDGNHHAFNDLSGLVIEDSNVKVTNSTESGMKIGSGNVEIKGNSNVVIVGSKEGDIIHRSKDDESKQGSVSVADTAALTVDKAEDSVMKKTTGNILAYAIELGFKKNLTNDPTGRTYDIVIKGLGGAIINDFESAHFVFDNKIEGVNYTVIPNADKNITTVSDLDNPNRISFYRKANDENSNEIAANEIILGSVKFDGYGKGDFKVLADDAKVNVTTAKDNIAQTFIPDSTLRQLRINWDYEHEDENFIPSIHIENEFTEQQRTLNVNIAFNNDIASQSADYTEMAVEVTGQNGEKHLGLIGNDASTKYDAADVCKTAATDGNSVAFEFTVTAGYRYTVKLTGAGYRTYEYTTVIPVLEPEKAANDQGVTLNFWNNVKSKDNEIEIEAGNGNKVPWNFLAGEIVQDNKINKYDLAAVVSYFGEDKLVEDKAKADYNKYDLNRDGEIDSEDIAYVLVSFGK